jgi:replicative DNA helicase
MSSEDETADIINRAGDLIYKITVKRNRDSLEHIRPALVDGYNIIGASVKNKTGMLGVPTGFKQLDNMLSGFQGSQLIIVAGRPGVGKTSIALNMAQNIAIKSKVPVALFSLEMSREQLAMRMMCSEALVDSEKIRHGSVTDEDFDNLSQAVKSLADAPLYVDDTPTITVMEMLAKARRLKQEKGLGLVVIDYLQLMTGSGKRENRQQEVAGMTRSLKIMAKEINVPILLLSQLSRAVEQRETKRPQLSDLRESGSIEQDADVVMFLSRDKEAEQTGSNEIRLIVAKQRSGPTGDIVLGYRGEYTRFVELNN